VGVITKMKILAFIHQKFKFLCLEYDNVTFLFQTELIFLCTSFYLLPFWIRLNFHFAN